MAIAVFELTIEDTSSLSSMLDGPSSKTMLKSETYSNLDQAQKAAKAFLEEKGLKWPPWARWESVGSNLWAADTGMYFFNIVKRKVK